MSNLLQSYFFFNHLFCLNLACFVLSFFFFWHYFIQSSFALHSLHFELSRVNLSVSLDSLLYQLLLRQCSITVHIRRSTDLLFMIAWCTFHSPEGFARRVPLSSIRCNKGYENHKLKYVKEEENLSLSILKGLLLKCFEETRLTAI